MRFCVSALLAVLFLTLTVPSFAHHSFNSFWDMDKTVEITGIVKSVKLVNPHANRTQTTGIHLPGRRSCTVRSRNIPSRGCFSLRIR